jgi:hypothetical protein
MRLPRDQVTTWQAVETARAAALDIGKNPEHQQLLEQTFLMRLLLREERGRLALEAIDHEVPRLLDLGTAVVRTFDKDPTMARLSFRPASPTIAAIGPMRPFE